MSNTNQMSSYLSGTRDGCSRSRAKTDQTVVYTKDRNLVLAASARQTRPPASGASVHQHQ